MGKKVVSILYNADLNQVQGINFVNKALLECNAYFGKITISKIFCPSGVFNVTSDTVSSIGKRPVSLGYKAYRFFRTVLRKILSSDLYLFACLKFYLSYTKPAKKTVKLFLRSQEYTDYILFQDALSAYFFFKKKGNSLIKSIIVLHCGTDMFGQLKEYFPALFRRDQEQKLNNIYNYVFEKVNKVIYISENAYVHSSVPQSKRTFIYNGIHDVSKNSLLEKRDVVNFVCVGSITGHKGQELVVEAINLLPQNIKSKIHFYAVGDGNKVSYLEKIISRYKLEHIVTLTGVRNDIEFILQNMDVFIMPSISEGLPVSVLEALRAGLYIMVTDTGGNKELIGDGFGEIITREVSLISSRIQNVISHNVVCLRQKELSRRFFINGFTIQKMALSYEKCILSL